MTFEDALKRAQAARQAATRSDQDTEVAMLAIAADVYEQLRVACEGAFRALSQAGASTYSVQGLHVPGEIAVELAPYQGEGSRAGYSLYVLETGHPITADGCESKKGWWSGKHSTVQVHKRPLLRRPTEGQVWVEQHSPTHKFWTYGLGDPGTPELCVLFDTRDESTTIRYGASIYWKRQTVNDYVAMATAERLAELNGA